MLSESLVTTSVPEQYANRTVSGRSFEMRQPRQPHHLGTSVTLSSAVGLHCTIQTFIMRLFLGGTYVGGATA